MSTWITVSIVALLPMLLRMPRALSPLYVNSEDPSRFARPFKGYKLHTFTGYASDVGQRSDSMTTGQISSTKNPDGYMDNVSGSIKTEVVVTDRFFLTGADGHTQSFQLTGFDAAVGSGHLVSVAWVIKRFHRSGPYFMINDHTTGETFFHKEALMRTVTFPYPNLYLAVLCLMILPLPAVILLGAVSAWWQVPRFQRSGVRPLLDALDSRGEALTRPTRPSHAASPTPATASISSELKDLAALRDAGVLSQSELEAAKAKLLGT